MTVFARATPAQRADALSVWRAARTAAGNPPSPARVDRVREKSLDDAAYLLVGWDGPVIAMALAEPYREQRGTGAVRPHAGHISMAFVDLSAGAAESAANYSTRCTGRCEHRAGGPLRCGRA